MINDQEIRRFVQMNRSLSQHIYALIKQYLQEEECKLQRLAEAALLDPSLHYSATMQLGRVSLLRDFSVQLKVYLGEQNDA